MKTTADGQGGEGYPRQPFLSCFRVSIWPAGSSLRMEHKLYVHPCRLVTVRLMISLPLFSLSRFQQVCTFSRRANPSVEQHRGQIARGTSNGANNLFHIYHHHEKPGVDNRSGQSGATLRHPPGIVTNETFLCLFRQ